VFASDGLTALALAREQAPDVLLLDIGLPGMDGIAVAEALRKDGPAGVRIIGLSAHVGPHDEARARRAGMDAFLAKPVQLANLASTIAAQMRPPQPAHDAAKRIPDERLRQRLTAQFASETPRVLAEIRAALAVADWTRIKRSAHYLKNSADVLGMIPLQQACQQFATRSEPPDPAEIRLMIDALESAIPSEFSVLVETPRVNEN
jgi:CheY-like chemotaxis protein